MTTVVDRFRVRAEDSEAAYRALHRSGELARRAERAVRELHACRVCPRECGADRLNEELGACRVGRLARVSSCFPHTGEEDPLRGWRGSGTIFLARCNLRCVFCQNHDISQADSGREMDAEELAGQMLGLQARGCHNVNLVTPEHVVPQVLEALARAADRGLELPVVYNTSAYDSMESLALLDGVVDVYMPDFKFWDAARAARYTGARDYPEVARRVVEEMHRQVGDLVLDEDGVARRGLLVRHLVMPGGVPDTREIMRFLATEVSRDTYVNVMAQYRPAAAVGGGRYPEIDRGVTAAEYREALDAAVGEGIHRLDGRRSRG